MSKPKVAIVASAKNAAVDIVLRAMARHLEDDFNIDIINITKLPEKFTLEEYDLAHFGWLGLAPREVYCPCTVNVWSVPLRKLNPYAQQIHQTGFEKLIVDDVVTAQILGQLGFFNVVKIPLAFDMPKGEGMPFPEKLTMGYFGNDYDSKRFAAIDAAAKMSGIPLRGYKFDKTRTQYFLNPMKDIYPNISVYVHASMTDTNSMPAMEALACGRPVVSTPNPGLERVLREGENGYWFDGSPEDLIKKVKLAHQLPRPVKPYHWSSSWAAAMKYKEVFNEVLNNQ